MCSSTLTDALQYILATSALPQISSKHTRFVIPSFLSTGSMVESLRFWLMKAEPDSRIVKGKDVKVSYEKIDSPRASNLLLG